MPHNFLPPPFRCSVDYADGGLARVRPEGELDMATAPELEERLRQVKADGYNRIVVDLRELEFIDSTGLTLLTRWSLGAARDGYDLALIRGNDRVQRLFELTQLTSHFRFVDG